MGGGKEGGVGSGVAVLDCKAGLLDAARNSFGDNESITARIARRHICYETRDGSRGDGEAFPRGASLEVGEGRGDGDIIVADLLDEKWGRVRRAKGG